MKDPLQMEGDVKQVFEETLQRCNGMPSVLVYNLAINILVNAIRMVVPERKQAETLIDELFGKTKSLLLDFHYDPVTGKRRTMFPFTQKIEPPFLVNQSKIFPS